jgi:predicted HTH domain antitoxin
LSWTRYLTFKSKTLSLEYPESLPATLHMTAQEFEREAKLSMVVKLYETGRLSSSQAAALVEIPRVHFLYELKRFGVSPQQLDAGELETDLAHAEQALAGH